MKKGGTETKKIEITLAGINQVPIACQMYIPTCPKERKVLGELGAGLEPSTTG